MASKGGEEECGEVPPAPRWHTQEKKSRMRGLSPSRKPVFGAPLQKDGVPSRLQGI